MRFLFFVWNHKILTELTGIISYVYTKNVAYLTGFCSYTVSVCDKKYRKQLEKIRDTLRLLCAGGTRHQESYYDGPDCDGLGNEGVGHDGLVYGLNNNHHGREIQEKQGVTNK